MTEKEFIDEWESDGEYVRAHTSGSTGEPKTCLLLKSDMISSASATNSFFGLGPNSIFVCPLSVDYIAGKMMVVRALQAGGRLIMPAPSNEPDFPSQASLLAIVPSQIPALTSAVNAGQMQVDSVIVGGGPMSRSQKKMLMDAGINAYESYGMTETCSHVALRKVGEECFEAMPGIRFDSDERGCLIVLTEKMSFGRLVTNDVVILKDCHHFVWQGRFDNVINSGGIKIFPEKLEAQILSKIAGAPEFYITSTEDEKWGRTVVAVVAASEETAGNFFNSLNSVLNHKYLPKHMIIVSEIPRTSNGKIKRLPPEKVNGKQLW